MEDKDCLKEVMINMIIIMPCPPLCITILDSCARLIKALKDLDFLEVRILRLIFPPFLNLTQTRQDISNLFVTVETQLCKL